MTKAVDVVIVMGSKSDLLVMSKAGETLGEFGVSYDTQIVSAHRTPRLLEKSVRGWESRGARVIIAGAGGAAHLPGMLASYTILPVIGVPVKGRAMNGLDSLLSIAQMPAGVPVACVAVDNAANAGILAVEIIGVGDSASARSVRQRLKRHKARLASQVAVDRARLKRRGVRRFLASL